MSLDADVIVDRRRMRRKLTFWRVVAALVAIVAIGGAAFLADACGAAVSRRRQFDCPGQDQWPDPQRQ